MRCPFCRTENDDGTEVCFKCGRGFFALTQGSIVASRYEIRATLGQGGMGTVYKAHDRELDETVALKVLRGDFAGHPEIAGRFRSEIKLARRIRHRNVCGIHEYGQEGHLRFIAMEFIDGVDFRRVLRSRGALPIPEAFEVSIQVAEGLQAIHDEGIVHRDLKTPNIMRDGRGVVRLMDFGIAKEWQAQTGTSLTGLGQIVGTPEYMSPEQARGEKVDSRCDIYALGIVIFELFVGDVPFRGETPAVTLLRHINEPPPLDGPLAARLPDTLLPILRKALAKKAVERHGSAREVAEGLREARQLASPRPPATPLPIRSATAPELQLEAIATTPIPAGTSTGVPTLPLPGVAETGFPPHTVDNGARTATRPEARPSTPRAVAAATSSPAAQATAPSEEDRPRTRRQAYPPARATAEVSRIHWQAAALAAVFIVVVGVGAALIHLGARRQSPAATVAPKLETPGTPLAAGSPARPSPSPAIPVPPTATPARPALAPSSRPLPGADRLGLAGVARSPGPAGGSPPARAAPSVAPRPLIPLSASSIPRAGPEAPAATDPTAPAAPPTGLLQLAVRPYADVVVDGSPVGTTPMRSLTLAVGPHIVQLLNPDYQPFKRTVTIRPGETMKLQVDFPLDGIPK